LAFIYKHLSEEEKVKTIVLALSTTRQSPKTIDFALKEAQKEESRLLLLFIVDPDLPHLILDKMMDVGFMGDKPSTQVYDSILKEYRERGERIISDISQRADSVGIECEADMVEGEFVAECLKVIKRENPKKVILTRAQRSNLSRFLFGSAVNKLKEKSPSPIIIVKEN
jgi:nucleotide-binding universal stress UspA family protein